MCSLFINIARVIFFLLATAECIHEASMAIKEKDETRRICVLTKYLAVLCFLLLTI